MKLKISLATEPYIKNGQEYVKVNKCEIKIKINQLKMNFENLFPNDKALNEVGNTLVNENVDLFIQDVEPALEISLGELKSFVFKINNFDS